MCGGGYLRGPLTAAMWKLNPGELRWERMHDLMRGRAEHACCAVRRGVVVLGGTFEGQAGGLETTASVEISGYDSDAQEHIFRALPPLTRGVVYQSVAVAIEESASELGQVLLIGGQDEDDEMSSAVHLVDLVISGVVPLRACWMDASFAWVETSPTRRRIIQRRCWSRPRRGQRVRPAGSGGTCPT